MKQINFKYKAGDRVILKQNLLIVEIVKSFFDKREKKKAYSVRYPHLEKSYYTFAAYEDELEEKPYNYDQLIFNAYIEYLYKYNELLQKLYKPQCEDKVKDMLKNL